MRPNPIALNSLYIYSKINILAYCDSLSLLKKARKSSALGQVIPQVRRQEQDLLLRIMLLDLFICFVKSLPVWSHLRAVLEGKKRIREDLKQRKLPGLKLLLCVKSCNIHWLFCVTCIRLAKAQASKVH